MKIGITGASGHIGNVLCRKLLEHNHEIKALTWQNDRIGIDQLDIEFCEGSITDKANLLPFVDQCDLVINLAGKISIHGDPDGSVHQINVVGLGLLADACAEKNVEKLIHFSTIDAHQLEPYDKPMDEQRSLIGDGQGTAYYRSKADSERLLAEKVQQYGLKTTVVVPTSVLGLLDFRPSIVGQTLIDIYNNKLPALVKGGFDWVDVRDIAGGTVSIIEQEQWNEKFIFSGYFHTLKELAGFVGEYSGRKVIQAEVPIWVAKLGIPFEQLKSVFSGKPTAFTLDALNSVRDAHHDISWQKAHKVLGYQPIPIRQAVADNMQWFLEHDMIS